MSYASAELEKLFGEGTPVGAMRHIIPSLSDDFTMTEAPKWVRGGGESYILPFEVKDCGTNFQGIFKASTTMNPELAIERAISRRKLLTEYGIKAPSLYGHGNGIVLEEFLPHSLEEAHAKFGDSILKDIAYAHGTISALGFQPVANGILRDFRGDALGNMYLIDFGADLGSSSATPNDLWDSFSQEVQTRLDIDEQTVQTFRKDYEAGFNASPETKTAPPMHVKKTGSGTSLNH